MLCRIRSSRGILALRHNHMHYGLGKAEQFLCWFFWLFSPGYLFRLCLLGLTRMTEPVRRWLTLLVGLFFMGNGVALTTNALLGTTPISSLPLVAAEYAGTTLGICTFFINIVMLLIQKPLLGKAFTRRHFLQIPSVFVFALFIDLGMWLTSSLIPESWIARMGMCLSGCFAMAVGIMLEVLSNTTVLPGEGLVIAIAWRSRINFGNIKVLFDVTLVLLAVLSGVVLMGHVTGVREGTLVTAVLTGIFVRLLSKVCGPYVQRWLEGSK